MSVSLIQENGEQVTLTHYTETGRDGYGDAVVDTVSEPGVYALRGRSQAVDERQSARGVDYAVDATFLVAVGDAASVPSGPNLEWPSRLTDSFGTVYRIVDVQRGPTAVFGVVRLLCQREE